MGSEDTILATQTLHEGNQALKMYEQPSMKDILVP